ncbi:hypothetical protein [Actinophytocola glycyrrhizae]|uniref:Secreted protein n=1 Tax=Actinophytocola glycyrrhizae TaxID=2044873 RepID=A0ABV9S2I7_9PSEU
MSRTRITTAAAALAFLGVLATPALASAELSGSAPVVDRANTGTVDGLPLIGGLLGGSGGAGGVTGGLPIIGGLLG